MPGISILGMWHVTHPFVLTGQALAARAFVLASFEVVR
jgi:hypothetical protein